MSLAKSLWTIQEYIPFTVHFAACTITIYGQLVNNEECIEPRKYSTQFNNLKALQDNKQMQQTWRTQ